MKTLFIFLVFTIIISIPLQVYGYGLGDAESPVLEINDKKLKFKTKISPEIIDQENSKFDLKIELLDSVSEKVYSKIGIDLKILDSNDLILFEDKFYSSSNSLSVNFTPQDQQNFNILGDQNDDGFWLLSDATPLEITGPIFLNGGIYKIQASIKILEDQEIQVPNSLETILIIGEIIPFQVTDDGINHDLRFITYFDTIENLIFDENLNSVKAEMKFNWNGDSISEIPFIHSEVYLPQSWDEFSSHEINTFVNGIQVFGLVDKSQKDEIIIHFLINNKQLKNLVSEIPETEKDKIIFEVRTGEIIEAIDANSDQKAMDDAMVEISSEVDWKVYLWWEPAGNILPKNEISINLMFHDPDTNLMKKNISYDMTIYQNNEKLYSFLNSETVSGHVVKEFSFENEGDVKISIENINDNDTNVKFEFFVGDESQKITIPDWVKNNSKWWSEGNIDDSTFAKGIEFMIKEKIIKVPETEKEENKNSSIPKWVRNNASWWASNQISDKDFASGLQYLIKVGIITV